MLKSYQLYKLTDAKAGVAWERRCGEVLGMLWASKVMHALIGGSGSWDGRRQKQADEPFGVSLHPIYLAPAQVFMFVVNDKGSSWAYASPGFGQCLSFTHLRMMRNFAKLPNQPKSSTEVRTGARSCR